MFIYGGGWFAGTNDPLSYGPRYFMETGQVILVTISYRLATLGFLATGDSASPGNYGLKDQTMAMRWVRQNIAKFGGNPRSITIMGQSAGAASVQMHMVSPLSKGLFDASIAVSATALTPWSFVETEPRDMANTLAEAVGIRNARRMSSHELVERMRQVPAALLATSANSLKRWGQHRTILVRPVIEPPLEGAFLLEDPRDLFARGDINRVPHMMSVVETEGINFGAYNASELQQFNARIDELVPFILELDSPPGNLMTEQIKARYFPNAGIMTPANHRSWLQALNDRFFLHPFYRALPYLANDEAAPLYVYRFHYRGKYSYSNLFTETQRNYGAVHLDDMIYLFDSPQAFPLGLNLRDRIAKKVLMSYYVRFITGHNPGFPRCQMRDFEPICPYMHFDDDKKTGLITQHMTTRWNMDMVRFWDQPGDIPVYPGTE